MRKGSAVFAASLLVLGPLSAGRGVAQSTEPRPQEPPPAERPRTADEHHAARRQWLEQQRLGDTTTAPPAYGAARGPRPAGAQEVVPGTAQGMVPRYAPGYAGWAPPYGHRPGPYGYGQYAPGYGAFGAAGVGTATWCIAQLHALRTPYGGLPTVAVQALCMPEQQLGPRGHGTSGPSRVPRPRYDPAYPPVNRFYHRFQPPQDRASRVPGYGSGLYVVPPDPWRPPPWYWGVEPTACAEVRASALGGSALLHVGLPALGALTASELELAIEARLAHGQPVELPGLDGRWLVIPAGTELDDLNARPCRSQ